jgi:hypothetical protein
MAEVFKNQLKALAVCGPAAETRLLPGPISLLISNVLQICYALASKSIFLHNVEPRKLRSGKLVRPISSFHRLALAFLKAIQLRNVSFMSHTKLTLKKLFLS